MRKRLGLTLFFTLTLSLFSLLGYADKGISNIELALQANITADTSYNVSREQALADVLNEAKKLEVEIRSNQEAEEYLNYAARMSGIEAPQMHAATLGPDLIMIRKAHAKNPRVLREELLHTQQQKAGIAISDASVTNAEIEVRIVMLQNRYKWGITEEEAQEMIEDVRLIEKRGGY